MPRARDRSAVLAVAVVLLAACGAEPTTDAAPPPPPPPRAQPVVPSPTPAPDFSAYAVTARTAQVEVRTEPDGPVVHLLAHPQPSGAPLTFLLDRQEGDWLHVLLPVRPNGSTGWVRAADVSVTGLRHALEVHRAAHRLDLLTDGAPTRSYTIGVGTRDTPTPGGTYYLKELLRPPDPDGPYGPLAYGLSGFSTVLTAFAGGEGVIGLHGTDDPAGLGRDVSHGCIRLANDDIRELAALLPLGTPVRILA